MKISKILAPFLALFSLAARAAGSNEITLYDFLSFNDGSYPLNYGHLVRDAAGNFYGTTQFGGVCSEGTVFRLSPNGEGGWSDTVLHAFCGAADGTVPTGAVVMDSVGNVFGTTTGAGSGTCGTVFAVNATSFRTLHSFTCGADGGMPVAGLMLSKTGSLFGTTSGGGTNGGGVVFEISGTRKFTVLYNFCGLPGCADGLAPMGGVVEDSRGNLYGTSFSGGDLNCRYGSGGCGVVFELSKSTSGWSERVLHTFSDATNDGANPAYASLTLATVKVNGLPVQVIFGVTSAGGENGPGTAFQLAQHGTRWLFKVLHSFDCCFADGAMPAGTLLLTKGALIGTTPIGGTGDSGTVYTLFPSGGSWTEVILYSFANGIDGGHPYSGVIADAEGNLYGTASSDGGEFGDVYEITP